MKLATAKLKAEFDSMNRNFQTSLHADIDYTSQNRVLEDKIRQLQHSIEDAKKGIIRKSMFGGIN